MEHPPHIVIEHLIRELRAIIEPWPETSEKLSHGAPTWWGGRKTFASYHDGHYDDRGTPAIWIKSELAVQQDLIASDPDRFYRPKYVGPSGWVAVRLEPEPDWGAVAFLLEQGYRSVAPKRALKLLDE